MVNVNGDIFGGVKDILILEYSLNLEWEYKEDMHW